MQGLEDLFRIERSLLEDPAGRPLNVLHQQTGIQKSTLCRYLRTMERCGRATQTDDGAWKATTEWHLMHMQAHVNEVSLDCPNRGVHGAATVDDGSPSALAGHNGGNEHAEEKHRTRTCQPDGRAARIPGHGADR